MRLPVLAVLLPALVFAAGCRKPTDPVSPGPHPGGAGSPAAAVRAVENSWRSRDVAKLELVLTDDYQFVFANLDSAGNAYQNRPWLREDELIASRNCFANASKVEIALDPDLVALPDNRPGKDPAAHRMIRTSVALAITADFGGGPERREAGGFVTFYVVRGDSAAIPPELVARGIRPNASRWWIDRWVDETLPADPAVTSWGAIKAAFR